MRSDAIFALFVILLSYPSAARNGTVSNLCGSHFY